MRFAESGHADTLVSTNLNLYRWVGDSGDKARTVATKVEQWLHEVDVNEPIGFGAT